MWEVTLGMKLAMLLVGLIVASMAVLGVFALVRRQWKRGFWFGIAAVGASVAQHVMIGVLAAGVLASTHDGTRLPVEDKARLLGETISVLMNWSCPGMFAFPVGAVVAVVGLIGWIRGRRKASEE